MHNAWQSRSTIVRYIMDQLQAMMAIGTTQLPWSQTFPQVYLMACRATGPQLLSVAVSCNELENKSAKSHTTQPN